MLYEVITSLQSSHTTVQNNSPEIGPDGAPEIWVTRENTENSTEGGSENGSEDDGNIPALGFVTCIALLLAGALWSKKNE